MAYAENRRPQAYFSRKKNAEGRAASPTRGDEEELVADLLRRTEKSNKCVRIEQKTGLRNSFIKIGFQYFYKRILSVFSGVEAKRLSNQQIRDMVVNK